jgi:flavin reductase (DIM6/NTAB) family NADH-FMN oxidoreductase RutF
VSASHLSSVLGRLPSGLFIVTAHRDGEETGMLASWIMQAGFDPPMITVALHKDRLLARWLSAKTPFAVNLLADDQNRLVGHFGRGYEAGEPAFDGLEVSRSPSGAAVLEGTIGYLECEPTGHIDSADHRIFLARVVSGHLSDGERPMVHIRKNGLKY